MIGKLVEGLGLGLDSLFEIRQSAQEESGGDARRLLSTEAQDNKRQVATIREVEQQIDAGLSAAADTLATQQKDIWGTIYGVFDKFPDGASIPHEQLVQHFGEKSAAFLDSIGVQSIDITNGKNGQHYKLGFINEATDTLKTAELTHAQSVEFDVTRTADSIKLDNVSGVKVKKVGGHFAATIDQIIMNHDQAGNVVIVGKGHWGIFHGDKRIKIAPDGTVTTDK